jgi:hypothetical protein
VLVRSLAGETELSGVFSVSLSHISYCLKKMVLWDLRGDDHTSLVRWSGELDFLVLLLPYYPVLYFLRLRK